jgi:hypothetical protein
VSGLTPVELLVVLCCGFVVGGMAGTLGIGGSFLLVPLLTAFLKVPVLTAVGSTACQLLGPATTALLARRVSRDQFRLPLIITGGIIIGILVGTGVLETARQLGNIEWRGRTIEAVDLLVMSTYLVMLTGIGTFALYEVRRERQGRKIPRGTLARLRIPPIDTFEELSTGSLSIPVLSMFGLVSGLTAGLMGISGALILIPGMVYLLGIRSKQAIVASLVVVWITSFLATIVHAWRGNVDLALALALMSGGTIGARLGSELGQRLKGPALRRCIGWLALGAAVVILCRLVGLVSV